jgi:hypothetical protein
MSTAAHSQCRANRAHACPALFGAAAALACIKTAIDLQMHYALKLGIK